MGRKWSHWPTWNMRLSCTEMDPLPVSPRPFFDEAMGSWLGRIAGLYRMPLAEINARYQLKLPLDVTRVGWLLLPSLSADTMQRLESLTRVSLSRIQELQTPEGWIREEHRWCFCRSCLAMNKADLTAPYWQRRWLNPAFHECALHAGEMESLGTRRIGNCGNMVDLIKCVAAKLKRRDRAPI